MNAEPTYYVICQLFAKHRQPVFVIADYGLSNERVVFSIEVPISTFEGISSASAEQTKKKPQLRRATRNRGKKWNRIPSQAQISPRCN